MFSFDLPIVTLLERFRTDFLVSLFTYITMLGEDLILIVLMAFVYFMFDKKLAVKIFFVTGSSLAVNGIIKNTVRLPRPFASGAVSCVRPDTATGYSFPSGHTQNTATWTMAFSLHFKKRWMLVLSLIVTVLLAFSRVFLGAHFPTDVIVGALLGFFFAFFGTRLYERVQNKIRMFWLMVLVLTPLVLYYLALPDPLYEDFFKFYGMFLAMPLALSFEERFVRFGYDVSLSKRFLRVFIGVISALLIKEGAALLLVFSSLRLSLLSESLWCFILLFTEMALCPLLFKKLKI